MMRFLNTLEIPVTSVLKIAAFVAILSTLGCATTDARIGLPTCERPIPITAQIWNDLTLMRETMNHNQLVDAECIAKLRARIELHDASR